MAVLRAPGAAAAVLLLQMMGFFPPARAGGDGGGGATALTPRRPPVAPALVEDLFLGRDPMGDGSGAGLPEKAPDPSMTHVTYKDVDMVLEFAPQPVTLWVELGAFEGGSAIRVAERAARRAAARGEESVTSLLAVDTFLGDLRVLWQRPPHERRQLLRPDGTISLFDRFRANVCQAGQAATILPFPATSVVALRLLPVLFERGVAPRPQVIYLDSAHEEGEVLLELKLAWEAVAPGGIVFGDDWILKGKDRFVVEAVSGSSEVPPRYAVGAVVLEEEVIKVDEADSDRATLVLSAGADGAHSHTYQLAKVKNVGIKDGGVVQRDVLRFADAHVAELDDSFGPTVQPMRTLGRARPGLFVSYLSFQWFMRKRPDAAEQAARAAATSGEAAKVEPNPVGFDCWSDGFNASDCCDVARHGPEGRRDCWDLVFTFEQCCQEFVQ